jgi:tRNA dimethylallyltransferase
LSRLDPAAGMVLFERDWPRVQRALEFYLQTGESITRQRQHRPEPHESAKRLRLVALNPPRAQLYDRINRRTELHFRMGLVEEVKSLLERGVPPSSNALGAHGYRRVVEFLQGKRDLDGAIEQTKSDIRHYAKRQLTWFRHEPDVEWVGGFGEEKPVQELVVEKIADQPQRSK